MYELPVYAPDQSFTDNKMHASDYIVNLYPSADGYISISDFVRISSNKLEDKVIGSINVETADDAGSSFTFIGTTKGLYLLQVNTDGKGGSFVNVSRSGGYSLGDNATWSFALYGNYIVACNVNYPIQILNLRETNNLKFQDLTEAPRGTHVAVWGNHLVIIGVLNTNTGYRNEVAWSGLNNPHDWKFADHTSDADEQIFFDGGLILNATSSKRPIIFSKNKIYRGIYVPSSALIFTFTDINSRVSLKGINSVIEVDNDVYFYADTGFYKITPDNQVINIGATILNNYIAHNFSSESLTHMIVSKDYTGTRIMWAISHSFKAKFYDYILVYDYALNKWSTIARSIQHFINYTSFGYTLESLDKVANLDALPLSLDSDYWQQRQRIVGAIDQEGYLVAATGKQMEAFIRTGVISDNNNGFVSMFAAALDTVTDSYNVTVLYTDDKRANFNYTKYKRKTAPISRRRDEAIFNVRAKYIKIQYNIDASNEPYSIYNFKFKSINNGIM